MLKGAKEVTQGWVPGFTAHDGVLWADVADHMPQALVAENILKIDSHLSKEEAVAKGFTREGWEVNSRADYLAGLSATQN